MEKIEITEKTKNTKFLRKAIYQKMLERIENDFGYHSGFCYLSASVICINCSPKNWQKFNMYLGDEIESAYKELMQYRPKGFADGGYWFPHSEEGRLTRINILKEIIEKM